MQVELAHLFRTKPWQKTMVAWFYCSVGGVGAKAGLWTLDWTHGLDYGLKFGLGFG